MNTNAAERPESPPPAPKTGRRVYERRSSPAKARAWRATLKPSADLRHAPDSVVSIAKAILIASGGKLGVLVRLTRLAAIAGVDWRTAQGAVKRLGAWGLRRERRGREGLFLSIPAALRSQFLGFPALPRRAVPRGANVNRDSHLEGLDNSNPSRHADARRSARPTPPAPRPHVGRGVRVAQNNPHSDQALALRQGTPPGREPTFVPSEAPDFAPETGRQAAPGGHPQRSGPMLDANTQPPRFAHQAAPQRDSRKWRDLTPAEQIEHAQRMAEMRRHLSENRPPSRYRN
jgi:hypothetical protein